MSITTLQKSPRDELDYDLDYRDWLEDGDRITNCSFQISYSNAEVDRHDYTDSMVRVWIKGGSDGDTAQIDIEIETLQGRKKATCFKLRIKECR